MRSFIGDIQLLRYHKIPNICGPFFPLVYPCSVLLVPSPLICSKLNVNPPPTTTTSHKNSKFCDFIDFEKCPFDVLQVHPNTNGITVKAVYSGHLRDQPNVSAIDRCPLYRSLTKSLLKSQ